MSVPEREVPTVFLVEDDVAVRESLTLLFKLSNLRVESFASAQEFLAGYDPKRPGCLVLDVHLPGIDGVELHRRLTRDGAYVPTIFLTGHAPPDVSEENLRRGVIAVFEKPCAPEALIEAVRGALGAG
jgi:FixJ family two-component response regulator